jgi:hypothetical protein
MREAERAFEEHERALYEELLTMAQRGIRPGASVEEAIAEMRRAIAEDDDLRELAARIMTLVQYREDGYIRVQIDDADFDYAEFVVPDLGPAPDFEAQYRLAPRPDQDLMREEIRIIDQLARKLEECLPEGVSEEEREHLTCELLREDPELSELTERLEELSDSHENTVVDGLAKLAEEEAGGRL